MLETDLGLMHADRAASLAPYLDQSYAIACGVKWDLVSFSLGWPVVPTVFIEYLAPLAHVM